MWMDGRTDMTKLTSLLAILQTHLKASISHKQENAKYIGVAKVCENTVLEFQDTLCYMHLHLTCILDYLHKFT
jgi:hypothetical protein